MTGPKLRRVTVTLTAALAQRLTEVGDLHAVSVSAVVEIAVHDYLERNDPEKLDADLHAHGASKRRRPRRR